MKVMPSERKIISISMTQQHYKSLKKIAKEKDMSVSLLVRMAIDQFLEKTSKRKKRC